MCCISLACNMHRATARIVDQCSDKLQRGTCAKNTVRVLKNEPSLDCPQCPARDIRFIAPLPSENLSCDNDGHLIAAVGDDSDTENPWVQGDVWRPFPTSQAQVPSRPASKQSDPQFPGFCQIYDDDLAELSHEDGIQLIDDMYGAEDLYYSIEDMDTSGDEVFYLQAETPYDLEQAHNMIGEINEIIENGQKDAVADVSIYLMNGATPTEVRGNKNIDIEASIFEARELLDRAQHELDKLRHTRQEIESDFLWCLNKCTPATQVSVDSML